MSMSRSETTFYRPVRNYPAPLPVATLQIEAPPQLPPAQGGAAALLQLLYPLGGLVTMLAMLMTTIDRGGGSRPLLIAAEVAVMPFSIGLMFLSNFLQRRGLRQSKKAERDAYRNYLESIQRRLTEVAKLQTLYNARLYPQPARLPEIVAQRQQLWERRPADADFLSVRVGLAPTALCCPVSLREDYRSIYDPALLQEARALVTRYSHIDAQPLIIPLGALSTFSVIGPRSASCALLRAMLAEIITFHAASEVRIIGYFSPQTSAEWSWLKWTPHTRRLRPVKTLQPGDPELYCMLADTLTDLQVILETQVGPELEQRHKLNEERKGNTQEAAPARKIPHLVILLDGFSPSSPLARVPGLEELMHEGASLGITVVCLAETQAQEPASTRARLSVAPFGGGYQLSYKETTIEGREVEFVTPDALDVSSCEAMARALTPLQLVDREAEIDYAQDIGLLSLYLAPAVEHLDILQSWRERDEKQLLRVPIGIQKGGVLSLDLKEMAMGGYGPHGLVVGATGSGKSELLRTVVTSLALTHDPFTLNFVLVDFKAGAAFADFADLPHMAGMITNLENDPQLIIRMYASLLGEQQRRQTMLSRAGNLANIRQYQAKWRRDPAAMEPMPYLLIIVDEFAQLIASYEDFLALFVKFGQVGRSLGMHMMLATQRVDEGRIKSLEGHLRYRICLRTFKPDESVSVIGKPDAYYLPPSPGSGYFKVDEDIYTGFKTAQISMPYVPPEKQQVDPLDLVCEFTSTGHLRPCRLPATSQPAKDDLVEEQRTEMNMVVERIAQIARPPGGWRVHAVWQPPLGEAILLSEILQKSMLGALDGSRWPNRFPLGPLCVPIGMLDRPAEQVQTPVVLDFSGVGGHLAIVGAPQSGKSTLLRTLLASFMVTHTPRDVQIYGIDFGGGLLRVFDGAPHVGAICSRADRDKMRRVLRRLKQVIVERETLFVAREIESMAAYRQLRKLGKMEDQEFGDVFLVIDNFGQLQTDFEMSDPDIINDIVALIANGLTYGVHVVLATNLWSEIRPRLRSNIGSRLELRLNDPGDSEIDRKLAATIPASMPGRGLHPEKLLFQAALPIVKGAAISEFSVQQALEDLIQRARRSWQAPGAPPIRVLPLEVSWNDLPVPYEHEPAGVPLGLEELRLGPWYLDLVNDDPHLLVLGDRECGKTTLLRTWLRGLEQRYTPEQAKIILIDYRKTLVEFHRSAHLLRYAITPDQVKEVVNLLGQELEQRLRIYSEQPVEHMREPEAWAGQHYYLFVDDYEGVATPSPQTSSPLNPLEGFLQSAREIGFHVVLARRVMDLGRTNYDPIFRTIKNMDCPGLLMNGDPSEGRQALHKQNISDALPPGRGILVRRGTSPMMVQIARSDP